MRIHLAEVDSTNAEAWRRHAAGERGPLWITADRQTAGRGRSGRGWASAAGNLYASLLLRLECRAEVAPQLAFVTAVAAHVAVSALLPPSARAGLRLKWPNDLLHDGRKLAGILIESALPAPGVLDVVIGTGINVASRPELSDRETASLAMLGVTTTADAVFQIYADAFATEMNYWNAGSGFAEVRTRWLDRGTELASIISVNSGRGPERGIFSGLDHDGALLLLTETGAQRRISFGDVELVRPAPPTALKGI